MAASFLVSTLVVTLAEIGDKTQLLSLMLAARFRRPVPIVIGILLATLLNHAIAAISLRSNPMETSLLRSARRTALRS